MDFNYELDRLKTFKHYPNKLVSAELLARTGFYYKDYKIANMNKINVVDTVVNCFTNQTINDETICFFCNGTFKDWKCENEVVPRHYKNTGYCPFISRRPTLNVPIDKIKLDLILPPMVYDECGSGWRFTKETIYKKIQYKKFANYDVRLTSFDTWPTSKHQKPTDLAAAGLFYTCEADKTVCYYCGVGLLNWEPTDDPWVEHARWSKKCFFLEFVKGSNFVILCKNMKSNNDEVGVDDNDDVFIEDSCNNVNNTNGNGPNVNAIGGCSDDIGNDVVDPSCFLKIETNTTNNDTDDHVKCKQTTTLKCINEECTNVQETSFLPCEHTLFCAICAINIQTCPDCNTEVEGRIRYFYNK